MAAATARPGGRETDSILAAIHPAPILDLAAGEAFGTGVSAGAPVGARAQRLTGVVPTVIRHDA